MKMPDVMLLVLFISASVTGAEREWFLPRDCPGPVMSLEVSFDDSIVLKTHGPACDEYKDNRDRQWAKEMLTKEFEPNREITWTGYRDEPFKSSSDSALIVDVWLAGADTDQAIWILGVSVRGDNVIYMNTLHIADLTAESNSCIAPRFCIRTSID